MSACARPAAILIVEDDAVTALDLELHLLDMGYRVLGRADSGERALALAARERPDLVLMDIGLRGELDGVRTAERLRRQGAMPVIFLTSHTDARTVAQAVEAAPYGYLTKPVQPGDLRASIQIALVRAQLEEQLLDSEQRWRRVFHDAPLGMALVSLKGEVLQANATLGRLLGVDAAQLRGRSQAALVHPGDQALQAQRLQELQDTCVGAVQFEMRYLRADGGVLWTQVSVSLLEPHAPSPRLLYQVQDLTAQRLAQQQRAELELRQAQQQAQAQLLSRVSHEMRTPLNAVLGFTQLLRLQLRDPAGVREDQYLEHIETAGRHLLAMVEDLLVLQRAHVGALKVELQSVAAAHSVQHALALLAPQAAAAQVCLLQDVPAELHVRADPVRLHQIVSNLASNAIKYNRPGGELRVTASRSNARVRLSFADNGIGMTPQQLQEVFQPFARAGRERSAIPGTGLGLVISRRLAEAMHGTLDMAARGGGGTVATLELAGA
ncbi:hybrid sensor histidine kinase/response regulator [Azohydromonas caseinilytica]|uniref:histidine kinase n=1 Tax=Azohydromonas caseinilytica TaxID=2728836 RepID=A0A848FEN1_9BURK|nr:ATP-binding protein [Azohydromonas caseinilytica]NML16809.1 response regulator [Azohydromonas caseinilytica]